MPDFQTIKLCAPFSPERSERGGESWTHWIDGEFELLVQNSSRRDTVRVARLLHTGKYGHETHEFRLIDGRLFRPFRSIPGDRNWTRADLLRNPPVIRLAPERAALDGSRTPFLHSPFAPELGNFGVRACRRARREHPNEFEQTARQVAALGDRLRLVEGTLFQETRAPAWSITDSDEVHAVVPDLHDDLGLLVDPRYRPRDLRQHLIVRRCDRLELLEPSLLPPTIEGDALAALCRLLHREMLDDTDRRLGTASARQASALFAEAEQALRDGDRLDGCYAKITAIAGWDENMTGEGLEAVFAHHASSFSQLLEDFPPKSRRVPTDGDDIDPSAFRL